MQYFSEDDIAQISSAPGAGDVGVVRLSGPNAFSILAGATAGLDRTIVDHPRRGVHACDCLLTLFPGKTPLSCPALAFLMPEPGSYTRENTAELHLPGAPAVLRAALRTLTDLGARAAAPGEFSFRAFRNGRLSLGQAEAVEESIRARNENERRIALFRLGDANPKLIRSWRDAALEAAALLEAAIDFERDALGENPAERVHGLVADLAAKGVSLAGAERMARPDLPLAALVGLTNAGKSSLANALLGSDEFLVSAIPSTTRDHLYREVEWSGVKLLVSDNPGHDPAAAGGAASRGLERLGSEDLACWVVDGSGPVDDGLRDFAARLGGKVLVFINKCDLPVKIRVDELSSLLAGSGIRPLACLPVSARTGEGIAEAKSAIAGCAGDASLPCRWNRRENDELAEALRHLQDAERELAGPGREELAADDLRAAVQAFSGALGEGYAEETLAAIFSRFCLGK